MIYFLRHTLPDVKAGVCYGVTDLELNAESYITDIAKIKELLDQVEFGAIYSSPLKRCRQAAEEIVSDNEITFDPRLKEMDFGEWEMAKWVDIFETQEGKRWFADYINCRTPSGESFNDMVIKAKSFIEEIKGCNSEILVVTHSGFIRAAMVAAGVTDYDKAFEQTIEYGEIIKLNI